MSIQRHPRCPNCRATNKPDRLNCWRCGWRHPVVDEHRPASHTAARCGMRAQPMRCPYCRQDIFHMSCRCGCSFFVNTLGDPWPKHACLTEPDGITCSFSYQQTEVPLPSRIAGHFQVQSTSWRVSEWYEERAPSYARWSVDRLGEHAGLRFLEIDVTDERGQRFSLVMRENDAIALDVRPGDSLSVEAVCEALYLLGLYEVASVHR